MSAADLYSTVVGQERAVAALRAAASRPLHAYLLVGPPGTGKAAAATAFAAALICPSGGDHSSTVGACDSCRRVAAGAHPDVMHVERAGAAIGMDAAREVIRSASLSPVEGRRKVMVLHDFHLVRDTGPALLKTLEEPPASTVFVVLAEFLPPELVTIASRCVRVDFDALAPADVVAALMAEGAEGMDAERAEALAEAAGGRLDRARLLAADPRFAARRRAWMAIPAELDGTGATAARVADRMLALLDESVQALQARQDAERAALVERNRSQVEVSGGRRGRAGRSALNAGVADLEERHRRQARRQRTDELRFGLAALASAYRPALATGDRRRMQAATRAVAIIDAAARSLEFNPNEALFLQALLARLGSAAAG
jgi:DNA polymerase-3 subunit delta'